MDNFLSPSLLRQGIKNFFDPSNNNDKILNWDKYIRAIEEYEKNQEEESQDE